MKESQATEIEFKRAFELIDFLREEKSIVWIYNNYYIASTNISRILFLIKELF